MKTRAPLVAAWTEQMNGHLLHANKLHLHEIDSNGRIVKEILPQEKRQFYPNDGKVLQFVFSCGRRIAVDFFSLLFQKFLKHFCQF